MYMFVIKPKRLFSQFIPKFKTEKETVLLEDNEVIPK
jgi:hypothetical protein